MYLDYNDVYFLLPCSCYDQTHIWKDYIFLLVSELSCLLHQLSSWWLNISFTAFGTTAMTKESISCNMNVIYRYRHTFYVPNHSTSCLFQRKVSSWNNEEIIFVIILRIPIFPVSTINTLRCTSRYHFNHSCLSKCWYTYLMFFYLKYRHSIWYQMPARGIVIDFYEGTILWSVHWRSLELAI